MPLTRAAQWPLAPLPAANVVFRLYAFVFAGFLPMSSGLLLRSHANRIDILCCGHAMHLELPVRPIHLDAMHCRRCMLRLL